ncbi:MAG TPA: hypothetical protein VFS76_01950 [Pyrinomonadaceae bacterium]|nr:hypothetical protein [Pyrinomonadaceae bacterium]
MSSRLEKYDLYLDETGLFDEGSDTQASGESKTSRHKGLSQLVGILVPRDTLNEVASQITRTANLSAHFPPAHVIHGYEIIGRSYGAYLKIVRTILMALKDRREWQCVRLVNVERISYFDRPTNYPNLVAELTLRTFQQKLKDSPDSKICIRLIDPKYKLSKTHRPLSPQEYAKRIPEYLGFAEVRYGLTRESRNWRFDGVIQRAYRESAALQICDILSHASADKFERIRTQKDLIAVLGNLLGEYDFTLTIRELFDRVDDLVKESSFGMALIVLAEALVDTLSDSKEDVDFLAKMQTRLNHILERLSRMNLRGRDPQLALLVSWLDQLIGHQRLVDKGYELAHWVLDNVDRPLRALLPPREAETVGWFTYAVHRWALTACNHKGVVIKGQAEVDAMKALQPSVARQWERIPLVMDGLITQAVHATDCLEFDEASRLMKFVAESLKSQSNRFHEVLPDEFPEELSFDLRARSLGTFLQSEILAGASDPKRLENARQASNDAIAEFTSFGDRARQYQYRCHLETIAGDFETARRFLVQSLEGTDQTPLDFSHNRISQLVLELGVNPEWKAEFTLVHWLRIGAYACLSIHKAKMLDSTTAPIVESERDAFLSALNSSGQLDSEACQGGLSDYPAHSILRFVAAIQAARGRSAEAMAALEHLHQLDPIGKDQFPLALILLAAQMEVALLSTSGEEARLLLGEAPSRLKSLPDLIDLAARRIGPDFRRISTALDSWREEIRSVTSQSVRADNSLLRLVSAH